MVSFGGVQAGSPFKVGPLASLGHQPMLARWSDDQYQEGPC